MTLCTRELLKLHKHKFTESTAQCVWKRSLGLIDSMYNIVHPRKDRTSKRIKNIKKKRREC